MTTPYLYEHQNRHAPVRTNGLRFWGYPSRPPGVDSRVIAVHTAESFLDLIGVDTGAENVARFQSQTERPSSYHRIADSDSIVMCLPDEAVAFGVGNFNSPTLHISLAMRAADWSDEKKAKAAEPTLLNAAKVCQEWVQRYKIPLRWLTRVEALAGQSGFVKHGIMDPERRSDPGVRFPAARFLDLSRPISATPPPAPVDVAHLIKESLEMFIVRNGDTGGISLIMNGQRVGLHTDEEVRTFARFTPGGSSEALPIGTREEHVIDAVLARAKEQS